MEVAGDHAMLLLARSPRFRSHLLRFVDALAGLEGDRDGRHLRRLLHEYLDGRFPNLPPWLQALLPILASERWPAPVVAVTARAVVRAIAARFIAGGGQRGIQSALAYLHANGRVPSFDVLGEYVASEQEADAYRDRYLELLGRLARVPGAGRPTPGGVPQLQVSLKLSSLTADFNPIDPEGTLRRVRPRLEQIVDAARRAGSGLTLDMERYETRDLSDQIFYEVFQRGGRFGDWNGVGVVLQAYLRDAAGQAEALLDFASRRGAPFQIRLVKGAYWDYETVIAQENGWPAPVWQEKQATDRTFESLSERLIAACPSIHLAIASHNLRSHAHAEAVRTAQGLPDLTLEHQVLYRTAEGIARALRSMGWTVRDYVPLGDLLPGMAYLVRRILENSSQVGFLLHSHTGEAPERLLAKPGPLSRVSAPPGPPLHSPPASPAEGSPGLDSIAAFRHLSPARGERPGERGETPFRNQTPVRLFRQEERDAFGAALASVRREFGQDYPICLDGAEVRTAERVPVTDPSHPEAAPLGWVFNAAGAEVQRALVLATAAADGWSTVPLKERAAILRRAAGLLAGRRLHEAAWIVHEAGKSWSEALADVDEAVDYLRLYPWQAERLAEAWQAYCPRGVVAVIPPWNFPIAIPCGMTAAALVCGNTVVLKPAEQTPLIARRLVAILHEAGVPQNALIWLPGRGEVAGQALVASPLVDMVAFTGSRAVGTAIYRAGSTIRPRRGGLRATVAEMGGKNAILVFPDADLDEAVVGILHSAFGHANQKCSAASRVLIDQAIYDRLRSRLVEGARSLPAGPADEPGTLITPLIDEEARARVRAAAGKAQAEGRIALNALQENGSTVLGPMLVELSPGQALTASTAQEEIFGPILALIPFHDAAEALRIANATPYALTAGVFSRSPRTIERTVRELDAGSVYVNRPITGARAGVEPFGGHKLSGTGPKAGGADYLWAFVTSRSGLRPDAAGGSDPVPRRAKAAVPKVRPWARSVHERGAMLQRALDALQAAGRSLPLTADDLHVAQALLRRLDELATPAATLPLPGQQTVERWDSPRGCGVVLVDEGAATANLLALVVAPLLAGNGIVVMPDKGHRDLVADVLTVLHETGVPRSSLVLAATDLDISGALALPQVTFAAAGLAGEATRDLYRLLGEASAAPDSPYLKALISLVDGPGPEQPGFLRRFALAKTVAIRTLHLGADLSL